MNSREVDVVVVGLGPGGEYLATELARAGLEVLAVDRRLVGGECPYYGCIPSKMMVRAADSVAEARRVNDLAGTATVDPDWTPVAKRLREEATTDWDDAIAVERLEQAGASFVRGEARLVGPKQVEVTGTTYTARRGVLLNTGTEPSAPPIDGLEGTPYWTNREAIRTETVPGSMIVLGGGAIGMELAGVFARFGSAVTVLESEPNVLAVEEPEAGVLLAELLAEEGLRVVTEVHADRVSHDGGGFRIGAGEQTFTADQLLVATGRRPNLGDIGLDTVGLDPGARSLDTDGRMRVVGAEGGGLWAIGDITGRGAFTHVSMYQAAIAVRDILGEAGPEAAYHAVPRVTFTDPEVGAVGLTERQARAAGIDVRVGTVDLAGSTRGWIHRARGLVKVVEDVDRGVLVGATVVGPYGGEAMSLLATAVHAEVPVATLRSMMFAYPTFHRAVESALAVLD